MVSILQELHSLKCNSLFILFILSVCSSIQSCKPKALPKNPESNVWEVQLVDMLPGTMVRVIVKDDLEAEIPILFKNKNGEALMQTKFSLASNDTALNMLTDSSGIIKLNITKQLIEENPTVYLNARGLLAKDVAYEVGGKTVVFEDGKSVSVHVIHFDNLDYIDNDTLKMYYVTDSVTAQEYYRVLNDLKTITDSVVGFSIPFVSAVLTYDSNYDIIGGPENETFLPITISDTLSSYWFMIHESVEAFIVNHENKSLYEHNPNLRFVGDGMAEFYSFMVLRSLSDKRYSEFMIKERIDDLEDYDGDSFNLNEWDVNDDRVEGYAFSMAFWLSVESGSSIGEVNNFFFELSRHDRVNSNKLDQLFESNLSNVPTFSISKDSAIKILKSHLNY